MSDLSKMIEDETVKAFVEHQNYLNTVATMAMSYFATQPTMSYNDAAREAEQLYLAVQEYLIPKDAPESHKNAWRKIFAWAYESETDLISKQAFTRVMDEMMPGTRAEYLDDLEDDLSGDK